MNSQKHDALEANDVYKALDILAPKEKSAPIDPAVAYARLHRRIAEAEETVPGWKRPIWKVVAACCALVLLLSFPPARTMGQKILNMLRVQKLAVVPVDLSAFTIDGEHASAAGKLLGQMISDDVVVTMKPGNAQTVADLSSASEIAGFPVRSLTTLGAPQKVLVQGEGAFHMTLDRDRMQAVLDEAGRSDIQIPESVDGSTVAVHIAKGVRSIYGTCGEQAAADAQAEPCISFMQAPSPVVSVPPGLDISALAEAGLQVAGMSAAEAQAFAKTVDWSSTLILPIPTRFGSSQTVAVDGVNGSLITAAPRGKMPAHSVLIWVKDGMIYALQGRGSADQLLAAAGSIE